MEVMREEIQAHLLARGRLPARYRSGTWWRGAAGVKPEEHRSLLPAVLGMWRNQLRRSGCSRHGDGGGIGEAR